MTDQKLYHFFEEFFKFFANYEPKRITEFYHLPCIFMDNSDFIPASSAKIISQFFSEFLNRNFKTSKIDVKSFEIADVQNASPTLFRVKVNFDVFDTALAKSRYCQVVFTLMKKRDELKIVTLEFLNLRVPNIEGITYNKNNELHTKFAKYMKPASQVI